MNDAGSGSPTTMGKFYHAALGFCKFVYGFNGANNALIASAAWPNRAALCTRIPCLLRDWRRQSPARRPVSQVPRRLPASTGSGCRIGSVQSTAPQYLAPSCARFDEDIGTHQLYGGPRRRHLRRPTQHEPGSRQREGSPVRIGVDISATGYPLDSPDPNL